MGFALPKTTQLLGQPQAYESTEIYELIIGESSPMVVKCWTTGTD
jgi:hypothetical protein